MPSIVPWGPSQDVFLVLDQFGERLGRAWRETNENDTNYETLIRHLLEGQCNNPVRLVAFNTDEGWSRASPTMWPTSYASAAPMRVECRTHWRYCWTANVPWTATKQ